MWGGFLIFKIIFPIVIVLCALANNYTFHSSKPTSYNYVTSIKSIRLQNIFVCGNNQIAFILPPSYQFKYLHPLSFISPSGRQIVNIIPQSIDILQPIIRLNLRYPLDEKGMYKLTFTGVEKQTNQQIDVLGEFFYK